MNSVSQVTIGVHLADLQNKAFSVRLHLLFLSSYLLINRDGLLKTLPIYMFEIISKPTLVLDEYRCKRNIQNTVAKAKENQVRFRPHFKTHQSREIGRWFRESDVVDGITVSTPAMARYFALDGWDDITIGFPFYPLQLQELQELEKICRFRLFVNHPDHLRLLNSNLMNPFKFYIEIDPGSGRSGIHFEDTESISALINESEKLNKCQFHGFYTHDGRTYKTVTKQQVSRLFNSDVSILKSLKSAFPQASLSMGDTVSTGYLNDFNELDEMSAGNFVFYDWMQTSIGSCKLDDVALFALLPVAQHIPACNRIILHGGAVHLSKDFLESDNEGKNYGQVIEFASDHTIKPIDGLVLSSLSQEHAILHYPDRLKSWVDDKQQLCVCPVHSCLTANLFDHYITLNRRTIEKRILS